MSVAGSKNPVYLANLNLEEVVMGGLNNTINAHDCTTPTNRRLLAIGGSGNTFNIV